MNKRRFHKTISKIIAFITKWTKPDTVRERLLFFMFLLLMSVSSIQRFAIYLFSHQKFADIPADEIAKAFLYGFRFDFVITCMLLVPLVLMFLLIPPKYDRKKYISIPKAVYCGLISTLVIFLSIADYFFFREFGKRLNSQVFIYMGYDYIHKIIINQYPFTFILVTTLIIFSVLSWRIHKYISRKNYNAGKTASNIIWVFFILAVLGIGIRGSLGPKAVNTGPAYFNNSNYTAQLTLNGLFTLREAGISLFGRRVNLEERFDILPQKEAISITENLLKTPRCTFLGRDENPLWRRTDTGKPREDYNVVLVVMESLAWPYIEPMGGEPNLTPNLNKLIQNGIFMDRCFSVGHRTTYGFSGIISGYPDLPEESVTTRQLSVGNMLTLGSVLNKRDYKTMFIYGGQPYYDHRQSFLGSNGFDEFIFEDKFPKKTFRTHLGWCDEDLFTAAHHTFKQQDKPFFAILLTLSFHRDYNIPKGKVSLNSPDASYKKQRLAVKYTDRAIGQYMKEAKKSDYFDNTIFVFTADHPGGFLNQEPKPTAFRIPFLIYAPEIIKNKGERISRICSQTDIAPTIMSLLGGSYSHSFFGSSVLERKPNEGRALIEVGDGTLAYIDGTDKMVIVPPYNSSCNLFHFRAPNKLIELDKNLPENNKRLRKKAIAILQTADYLYRNKSYQYP